MKNRLVQNEIRSWLDENLPYFKLSFYDDNSVRIVYNGKQIQDWELFQEFTSLINFPLDFSSSLYVGVTIPIEKLKFAVLKFKAE